MLKLKKFQHQDLITFDEMETIEGNSQRLYITPGGNFPSVTTILSILNDGGIERWKQRVGEEEANRIVTEAVNRGNSLHDLSEAYLNNQLTRDKIKGTGRVLFNRNKKHLDKIELVIATEVPLYSERYKYAGRVDGIVMMDGELCILDHKNSRNPIDLNLHWNRKKLYSYQVQCAAYAIALEEMKGLKATQGRLIVAEYETSTSKMFSFPLEPFKQQFHLIRKAYINNDIESVKKDILYFQL